MALKPAFMLAAFLSAVPAIAHAQPASDPQSLRALADQANDLCRGQPGDNPEAAILCEVRDDVYRRLRALGWCFGTPDLPASQWRWVRCPATSRTQGSAPRQVTEWRSPGMTTTRPFRMEGPFVVKWRSEGFLQIMLMTGTRQFPEALLANQVNGGEGESYVPRGGEFHLTISGMAPSHVWIETMDGSRPR